jgi:hypothetical protein
MDPLAKTIFCINCGYSLNKKRLEVHFHQKLIIYIPIDLSRREKTYDVKSEYDNVSIKSYDKNSFYISQRRDSHARFFGK